jgi:hypothetical protein
MTDKQPKALSLADWLEHRQRVMLQNSQAADDLCRQYQEIEALQQDVKKFREAASCERDVRQQLERTIEADEALLRQALEAMVETFDCTHEACGLPLNAIEAIRKRLGEAA